MIKINLIEKIYWHEEILSDRVNKNGRCYGIVLSDKEWRERFANTMSRPILWGYSNEEIDMT